MNPIHPTQARKLLATSKAPVFGRYPFTLLLNTEIENLITYPLTLKIDPCSKFIGISLVNNRDEVIWGMEFEHRGQQIKDVKDALFSRRNLRRARRSRNTRYRKAGFLNRKRPEEWLAPTLMHRVLTTETSVKRLCKLAPITEIRQELIKFDTQKI
jgi:hypothetical protein